MTLTLLAELLSAAPLQSEPVRTVHAVDLTRLLMAPLTLTDTR
jgi:hypothetical protein